MEVFAASTDNLFSLGLTMCQRQIKSEPPEKLSPGPHTLTNTHTHTNRILVFRGDVTSTHIHIPEANLYRSQAALLSVPP